MIGDEAERVWEPLLLDLVKRVDDDDPGFAVRWWRDLFERLANEGLDFVVRGRS